MMRFYNVHTSCASHIFCFFFNLLTEQESAAQLYCKLNHMSIKFSDVVLFNSELHFEFVMQNERTNGQHRK